YRRRSAHSAVVAEIQFLTWLESILSGHSEFSGNHSQYLRNQHMRCAPLLSTTVLVVAIACVSHGLQDGRQPRTILTSAHRGEHLRHPENSLPAIQAAIDAGMDFVELDVRTTADGNLVLMHDRTVDRMTNGQGAVASMTLAEVRKLDLGARFPGQFP